MKFAHPQDARIEDVNDNDRFIAELKMDGVRYAMTSVNGKKELINRSGKDKIANYPELQDIELPNQTILDGEVVVLSTENPHGDFEKVQQRDSGRWNHKKKMLAKKWQATYVVFDVKMWNGRVMKEEPYEKRREKLMEEIKGRHPSMDVVPVFNSVSEAWEKVVERDMEGIVAKQYGSTYKTSRTSKWYRVKNIKDSLINVYGYEEHSKGITMLGEDSHNDTHRVNLNGEVSKKVKAQLDSCDTVQVEVSHIGRNDSGKFREPRFKKLAAE